MPLSTAAPPPWARRSWSRPPSPPSRST